jgi:hypothetical protein
LRAGEAAGLENTAEKNLKKELVEKRRGPYICGETEAGDVNGHPPG